MALRYFASLAVIGLFFAPAAESAPEIGKPAPVFSTADVNGKKVDISELKGNIVVLEWNNPGCPFVHKFYDGGDMQKLQAYATGKKVVWLTINSSAEGKQGNMTPAEAKDYITSQKLASSHYVLDPQGEIGKLYEAKTTPHMFVIDQIGTLVYMGAIDSKPTADRADIKGAKNYVKAAIDGLTKAQPIEVSSTQAYGCSVKYKD